MTRSLQTVAAATVVAVAVVVSILFASPRTAQAQNDVECRDVTYNEAIVRVCSEVPGAGDGSDPTATPTAEPDDRDDPDGDDPGGDDQPGRDGSDGGRTARSEPGSRGARVGLAEAEAALDRLAEDDSDRDVGLADDMDDDVAPPQEDADGRDEASTQQDPERADRADDDDTGGSASESIGAGDDGPAGERVVAETSAKVAQGDVPTWLILAGVAGLGLVGASFFYGARRNRRRRFADPEPLDESVPPGTQ